MFRIRGACSRLIGDLVQVLRVHDNDIDDSNDNLKVKSFTSSNSYNPSKKYISSERELKKATHHQTNDMKSIALMTVFEMQEDGKIKKAKARSVLDNLGLVYEEGLEFDIAGGGDEVAVEEVLAEDEEEEEEEEGATREKLLREAFRVFDEDGNGFIDAVELKRVLECLGLDKGWDMGEVEKMLSAVDLNLDGKVDFCEFELMMGCS